jgi:(R,R)-butanediol dehydrogenase/meso-butanediol dehydrogenase/diacetyl reductase
MMRAAVFYGKRDVRLETVEAPAQPGAGQVLVKIASAGICGTDLHEYAAGPIIVSRDAHPYTGSRLPQILGHEFSGVVLATGSDVTHVRAGDRVSIQPQIFPQRGFYAERGIGHLSEQNATVGLHWPWGGFGELALVNDYNVYALPDDLSLDQGAVIEPAAVAMYAVDRSRLLLGETVFIAGGGPIGVLTAMAARAAGAGAIYISEFSARRRALIEALDVATLCFDPRELDVLALSKRSTESGVGFDIAFECVGNESALNSCVDSVRRQGRVVQVGLHLGHASVSPTTWALKDITIEGVVCYPVTIWPRAMRLIQTGRFAVESVVTRRIGIEEIVEGGFERLLDKDCSELKILVNYP